MPVLARRLLFVAFPLLILGGCSKTPTATSDNSAMLKKGERQQPKQQAAKGSAGHDSTDSGRNAAYLAANSDPKPAADSNTSWPPNMGEFSATSRDSIPAFPVALTGYRSEKGKDFQGKPYPIRGSIRVKEGSVWVGGGWKGLPDFPRTSNGCSSGLFMVRWRLSDPVIRVYSTIDNPRKSTANVATGAYGYMYGSVCDKPQFKFARATKPNWTNRVNVFYELKFWEATP